MGVAQKFTSHLYRGIVKPVFFSLDAETAHDLSLKSSENLPDVMFGSGPLSSEAGALWEQPQSVFGLTFANRIGVAAGLDKDARIFRKLGAAGFGHVEVGTVTPAPQSGNPKPRAFRLKEHQAIINRMGFPSTGVEGVVQQLQKVQPFPGVRLGINIGKMKDTPNTDALSDYRAVLERVYPFGDYFVVNVSSPNTEGLRELQQVELLRDLLGPLKSECCKDKPLLVKLAPDMEDEQFRAIARLLIELGIDGVVATNTTLNREPVSAHILASEKGGLSGLPLRSRSLEVVKLLAAELKGQVPIIGVGGITTEEDAHNMLSAGAALVQLYTALVYQGPWMLADWRAERR